jgi:hypothetical protein
VTNFYSVEFDLYFRSTQSKIQRSHTLHSLIKHHVEDTHTLYIALLCEIITPNNPDSYMVGDLIHVVSEYSTCRVHLR